MSIADKTVLFRYILKQFGFEKFEDLQNRLRHDELSSDTADHSLFYLNLLKEIQFDSGKLKEYDENVIRHLQTINRHRNPKINLKYFQYFSLMFTEYYLDRYFEDSSDLAESLEEFGKAFFDDDEISFGKDDLNLIAYWMATGSGKTLVLHFNILQYRHYAKAYKTKFWICSTLRSSIRMDCGTRMDLTAIASSCRATCKILKRNSIS